MLGALFLSVLNMSIIASLVMLMVMVVRLLLKKAPKIFTYALWAIVLFRLICPFSFESAIGLLPINATPIPQDIMYSSEPQIDTGLNIVDSVVNQMLPIPNITEDSVNPLQIGVFVGSIIWVIGITAMLIYSIIQFVRLKQKLIGSTPLRDNIYLADHISSPFVMGFVKPKIYLPSSMTVSEQAFIIVHEQCHIKRLDHIARILAFTALTIHWFNPLVWLAFVLSGKDMEMSCDEAVMKRIDTDIRAEYSQSLLRFATGKKFIAATPLAFGEGDTKDRVKNVMRYKKPMLWVIVVSAIVIIALGVGLMSNSKEPLLGKPSGFAGTNAIILAIDAESKTMVVEGIDQNSTIGDQCLLDWSNANFQSVETDGNLKTLSINDFAAGDHVVLFLHEIQDTYPPRAKATTVQLNTPVNVTPSDYKPAIMINNVIYWLSPDESIAELPQTAWLFGQIQKVSPSDAPPDENFETIGLDDSWIGKDFYIAADGGTIYLKGADDKYMQFVYVIPAVIITEHKNGEDVAQFKITDNAKMNRLHSLLVTGELTREDSVNDAPNMNNYFYITFQNERASFQFYIYEKDGKHYIEQPYSGIWEISNDTLKKILTLVTE